MEHFNVEERISITIDDYERLGSGNYEGDEYDSFTSNPFRFLQASGMTRLEDKGVEHKTVAKSFVSGLGLLGRDARVVAVHKNWSSDSGKTARAEAFRIFSVAVAAKCGGDANIKFAWYGAPIDEICDIVSHGFTHFSHNNNDTDSESSHGVGVHLSPGRFSIDCVSSSATDRNGLRHMLLCRVILGKVEAIPAGSTQSHPTSSAFDTAVDNLFAPRKYIVWAAFMNSHIQPVYVVSFKAPDPNGAQMNSVNVMKPTSPWMSFPTLMSALSRFLDPGRMSLIQKCHKDFVRNKIPRPQLINRVRHIAGDELLIALIKKHRRNEVMPLA